MSWRLLLLVLGGFALFVATTAILVAMGGCGARVPPQNHQPSPQEEACRQCIRAAMYECPCGAQRITWRVETP